MRPFLRLLLPIVLPAIACAGLARGASDADDAALRAAVAKSLPLLELSAMRAIDERPGCFTCHHTGLPAMTLLTARERGFAVNADDLQAQLDFTAAFLARGRTNYLAGKGQGGAALTAGSALWTLKLGGRQADETTEAVVAYLLEHHRDLKHWKPTSIRPPSEGSDFATTFVVLEAIGHYRTAAQEPRAAARLDQAREWLLQTPAPETEDRVFRLWALVVAGADPAAIRQAADELLRTQREDGGWTQLEALAPDAYATATALVALHRTGVLATTDPAYRRGLHWLLRAQLADGSWHVATRSKPIQKPFESGYPHGKDQFISITAACWATTALALALPAAPPAP